MVAYISHTLSVLFVAVLFVFYKNAAPKQDKLLLVGILSAPEHFKLRETIRKTWVQHLGKDITYYFLIGKQMCHIPIEDRVDEFSCEESALFFPSDTGNNTLLHSGTLTCNDKNIDLPIYSGYTFTVQHDIITHRIGILSDLCEETVRVSLVEAATGFKITSATFISDEPVNSSSIIWKPVEQYRLPRGFEGRVVLERSAESTVWHRNCGFNWKSSGNILTYNLFWNLLEQPVHVHHNSLSAITLGFELADVDNLRTFLSQKSNRKNQWDEKMSLVSQKLHTESSKMNDILFLSLVDVYRSLPKKMLNFYKWADENAEFSFLLKADDDTFINIPPIMKELQSLVLKDKELASRIWWWSAFREGWPVQLFGKWRETSYRSVTYPAFPCGSGYVLSRGAIHFLSRIADKLYTEYQGEDAALGIWLASTNPRTTQNQTSCLWTCETSSRVDNSCNYPQLSPEQMLEISHQIQGRRVDLAQ